MKSISIETVNKGWIVRELPSGQNFNVAVSSEITAYAKIEDLQKDLPQLLEVKNTENNK